eukprot:gene16331-25030_t
MDLVVVLGFGGGILLLLIAFAVWVCAHKRSKKRAWEARELRQPLVDEEQTHPRFYGEGGRDARLLPGERQGQGSHGMARSASGVSKGSTAVYRTTDSIVHQPDESSLRYYAEPYPSSSMRSSHGQIQSRPSEEDLNVKLLTVFGLPTGTFTYSVDMTPVEASDEGSEHIEVGDTVQWHLATTTTGTLLWNTTRYLGCTRGSSSFVRVRVLDEDGFAKCTSLVSTGLLHYDKVLTAPIQLAGAACSFSVAAVRTPAARRRVFVLKLPGELDAEEGITAELRPVVEAMQPRMRMLARTHLKTVQRVVCGPSVLSVQIALACTGEIAAKTKNSISVSRFAKLNMDAVPGDAAVFSQTLTTKTHDLYDDSPATATRLLQTAAVDTSEVCSINSHDQTDAIAMTELLSQLTNTTDHPILLLLSPPVCHFFMEEHLSPTFPAELYTRIDASPSFSVFQLDFDLDKAKPLQSIRVLPVANELGQPLSSSYGGAAPPEAAGGKARTPGFTEPLRVVASGNIPDRLASVLPAGKPATEPAWLGRTVSSSSAGSAYAIPLHFRASDVSNTRQSTPGVHPLAASHASTTRHHTTATYPEQFEALTAHLALPAGGHPSSSLPSLSEKTPAAVDPPVTHPYFPRAVALGGSLSLGPFAQQTAGYDAGLDNTAAGPVFSELPASRRAPPQAAQQREREVAELRQRELVAGGKAVASLLREKNLQRQPLGGTPS